MVTVKPITQWAKNKVRQHGERFEYVKTGSRGTLLRSVGDTWKGPNGMERWLGWFSPLDANLFFDK